MLLTINVFGNLQNPHISRHVLVPLTNTIISSRYAKFVLFYPTRNETNDQSINCSIALRSLKTLVEVSGSTLSYISQE